RHGRNRTTDRHDRRLHPADANTGDGIAAALPRSMPRSLESAVESCEPSGSRDSISLRSEDDDLLFSGPPRALDWRQVSAQEVDEYLRDVEEPKRSTLETLRRTILGIVPEAEQVISYRVPLQSGWEDGRRLRRLQGPPELPAVQRLRSSATDGGTPGLHHDEERSAFSGRSPAAEDARHEARSRAAVRDPAPAGCGNG